MQTGTSGRGWSLTLEGGAARSPLSQTHNLWLAKRLQISLRRSLIPSNVANDESGQTLSSVHHAGQLCERAGGWVGGWRRGPESPSNKAEGRRWAMQQQTLHSPGAEGCSRCRSARWLEFSRQPAAGGAERHSVCRDLKHSQEVLRGVYKYMHVHFNTELGWRIIQCGLVPHMCARGHFYKASHSIRDLPKILSSEWWKTIGVIYFVTGHGTSKVSD